MNKSYVVALQRQNKSYRITIPRQWIIEHVKADSHLMFLIEDGPGKFLLYSEEEYYYEHLTKCPNGADMPTSEAGSGPHRARRFGGVGSLYPTERASTANPFEADK
jgi:hypothetical protein